MRKFFVPRPARKPAVTIDHDGMVRISPTALLTPQDKFAAHLRFMSLAGSPGPSSSPPTHPGGSADTTNNLNVTRATAGGRLAIDQSAVDQPSESLAGSAEATADKALPAYGGVA